MVVVLLGQGDALLVASYNVVRFREYSGIAI